MDEVEDFRPKIGDTSTPIPIALEAKRVLGMERFRGRLYFLYGFIPIFIILDFVFLFGSSMFLPLRLLVFVLLVMLEMWGLRYLNLEEQEYRKDVQGMFLEDYKLPLELLWGVFQVSPNGVLFFNNGLIGILARFDRNVKVGRDTDTHHFEHYTAIADAYNLAGSLGCTVTYVDYMGTAGIDQRLTKAKMTLPEIENPDVRDVMLGIYDNLEKSISETSLPVDVFLLTMRGYEDDLLDVFSKFSSAMLNANFVGYSLLSRDDLTLMLRDLWGVNFNLDDILSEGYSSQGIIHPIRLVYDSGEVKELRKRRSAA